MLTVGTGPKASGVNGGFKFTPGELKRPPPCNPIPLKCAEPMICGFPIFVISVALQTFRVLYS